MRAHCEEARPTSRSSVEGEHTCAAPHCSTLGSGNSQLLSSTLSTVKQSTKEAPPAAASASSLAVHEATATSPQMRRRTMPSSGASVGRMGARTMRPKDLTSGRLQREAVRYCWKGSGSQDLAAMEDSKKERPGFSERLRERSDVSASTAGGTYLSRLMDRSRFLSG